MIVVVAAGAAQQAQALPAVTARLTCGCAARRGEPWPGGDDRPGDDRPGGDDRHLAEVFEVIGHRWVIVDGDPLEEDAFAFPWGWHEPQLEAGDDVCSDRLGFAGGGRGCQHDRAGGGGLISVELSRRSGRRRGHLTDHLSALLTKMPLGKRKEQMLTERGTHGTTDQGQN